MTSPAIQSQANIKLSVVIPCYTLTAELEDMALHAAESYKNCDELIIVEDGGEYSEKLREIADVYLYFKDNKGFTVNVNRGWKVASGDYTAIVSSDTYLLEGDIYDLCVPGKVTSPHIVNQYIEYLAGPFWVTPKALKEQYGLLREEMRTYCSDSEYDNRMRPYFQKVETVKIMHHMMQTVQEAGVEGGDEAARDQQAYEQYKKLMGVKETPNLNI